MANTKITTDALALDAWWGLPNFAANPAKPTVAELNAALKITGSIAWDGYSFGAQASNQTSDPSWIDVGNTQQRGFAQFGGTISFFYPGSYANDPTNVNYTTFAALKTPGTYGYLIIRHDGKKTATNTVAIANDMVDIYYVQTDAYSDVNTGEASFKYTVGFLPQGSIYTNALVATTVTVSTPAPVGTTAYTVGGKTPLTAAANSRTLYSSAGVYIGTPQRFNWSSSNSAVASVSANGVVTGVSAGGPVNIIATDPLTNTASTALAVTIV